MTIDPMEKQAEAESTERPEQVVLPVATTMRRQMLKGLPRLITEVVVVQREITAILTRAKVLLAGAPRAA